jgi:hypothetical protein
MTTWQDLRCKEAGLSLDASDGRRQEVREIEAQS